MERAQKAAVNVDCSRSEAQICARSSRCRPARETGKGEMGMTAVCDPRRDVDKEKGCQKVSEMQTRKSSYQALRSFCSAWTIVHGKSRPTRFLSTLA